MFSLEESRFRELLSPCISLMGQKEKKGTTLPSEVPIDRGRVNGDELKTRKVHPDTY